MSDTQYSFGTFRRTMAREMTSADDLYARANTLRAQGRAAEANRLESQAERVDNRHANTSYSSFLDRF